MSDVPPDVIPNILYRLPVESLLRFRRVCKSWRRIIDDPAFIELHLHRQSDAGGHLIFRSRTDDKLYTLSTNSLYHYSQTPSNKLEASPLETLTLNGNGIEVPDITDFPMHPSCNGLILIKYYVIEEVKLMVWNPFTREEIQLLPDIYNRDSFDYIGLGYDFVSDDYKVLKIEKDDLSWKTFVYSLKSKSWRIIMDSPSPFIPKLSSYGVFVKGRFHWITDIMGLGDGEKGGAILAFDLATEDFHLLPLPDRVFFSPRLRLDALGECLFLTRKDSIYRLDDYGGKKSWTNLFSINDIDEYGYIRPIAYLKAKAEVLVIDDRKRGRYYWVNIDKKSAKEIHLYVPPNFTSSPMSSSLMCIAGLVRLSKYSGTDRSFGKKETSLKTNAANIDGLQLTLRSKNVEKTQTMFANWNRVTMND